MDLFSLVNELEPGSAVPDSQRHLLSYVIPIELSVVLVPWTSPAVNPTILVNVSTTLAS